jgi:hypothetical protein
VSFPAGLLTITVTGLHVLDLAGEPLDGEVIFTPSGPVSDPAVSALLEGSAVGQVVAGVMSPLVLPATDSVSPAFTYTISTRLTTEEGALGSPAPVTGVSIPHTLGASVDLSVLL